MQGKTHLLVIGSGSVGRRHSRNFAKLGCAISCVDPREDRRAELASEVSVVATFPSIESALRARRYDAAVVSSPPHVHVPQTFECLNAGLPVLLEKPICANVADAASLHEMQSRAAVPVLLGYTWRWWPPLHYVRELLAQRVIGTLRHVRFVMSAHLADWHPWERYQDFFMARRELGGGALLDESHWTDLACWLFGLPDTVCARVEKISNLDIDADDNVDMLLTYRDGPRVYLHLDLYGRPHEKTITFVGDEGTIRWSADPNRVQVGRGASDFEETRSFACERNDMFVAVAEEFLQVVAGGRPSCTLTDGMNVMRIVEAARASGGRTVNLAESAR